MSIFGSIMNKIWGGRSAQAAAPAATPDATAPPPTAAPAPAAPAPTVTAPTVTASPAPPAQAVDVEAVLTEMAGRAGQKLDWRRSIVDLMKLLGLDSSLDARRELAKELNYSGDTQDSAAMNIWLHRQVMVKLAENGGKVPDSLR